MDDLISREDALKVCEKYNGQGYVWSCIRGDIEKLPSAQPELIERTAYIRGFEQGRTQGMIDSEGGKNMIKAEWTNADALNLQPTCNQLATDCISRQFVIEKVIEVSTWFEPEDEQANRACKAIRDYIERLPSVQLTQPNASNTLNALDCISRQAAVDRINKQRKHLQPDVYPQDKIGDAAYQICAEFIERLPSAQSEIIRCKYCKHYGVAWLKKDGTDDRRYKNSVCLRGKYAVEHKPDWYCADAERRTDEIN